MAPNASTDKLTILVTPEGEIDWGNMRPSVREKFLGLVENDVTTLEHIGMAAQDRPSEEGGEGKQGITLANVHAALDVLGKTNAILAQVIVPKVKVHPFKRTAEGKPVPFVIDPDIAVASFHLTEEQHAELDPRLLAQVKSIPIPEWLDKWMEPILLFGMYAKFTADNLLAAMGQQVKRDYVIAKTAHDQRQAQTRVPDSDFRPNGHVSPEPPSPTGESIPNASEGGFPEGPEISAP